MVSYVNIYRFQMLECSKTMQLRIVWSVSLKQASQTPYSVLNRDTNKRQNIAVLKNCFSHKNSICPALSTTTFSPIQSTCLPTTITRECSNRFLLKLVKLVCTSKSCLMINTEIRYRVYRNLMRHYSEKSCTVSRATDMWLFANHF